MALEMLPNVTLPVIKLRLEVLPRYKLTLIYAAAFTAFIACFIGAFFSPEMITERHGYLGSCFSMDFLPNSDCLPDERTLHHPAWFTVLSNIDGYQQFFMLEVEALQAKRDEQQRREEDDDQREESATLRLHMLVSVRARSKGSDDYDYLTENRDKDVEVECHRGRSCGNSRLFYEPYISYENYEMKVAILNWRDVSDWLANLRFTVKFVNPSFTKYALACKYLFFILSAISNLIFFLQLRSTPLSLLSFETKYIGLIGLSCMMMNDPTYAGGILSPNEGWSVYSVLCVTQFIGLILSFWMLTVQRLKSSFLSLAYYAATLVYIFVLIGLLSALYVFLNIRMKYDPSFDWKTDLPKSIKGVTGAVIALLIILILYMIGLTLRAMPGVMRLGKRQMFLLSVNTGMLIITILGIAVGLFQPLPRIGAMLLIMVAIYNLYVYLLQVLFIPTKEALEAQFRAVELDGQIAQMRFEEDDDASKIENRV